jgi:presenilin 1
MADRQPATAPPVTEDSRYGYGVDHLSAVVRPVALTMICASLAVAWVRDPAQDASIASGLSSYLVYSSSGPSASSDDSTASAQDSTGTAVGEALINAIVIVCVVAAATFVLVACYYFRCLKLMLAYLVFASVNLLGYTGSIMVISAVNSYRVVRSVNVAHFTSQ